MNSAQRVVLRGPWVPDLTQFKTTGAIAARGLKLAFEGKVRELVMFPGVFHVEGNRDAHGRVTIYTVDVREKGKPTCQCRWWQERGVTSGLACKHIAAVGAWYIGRDEKGIRDALGGRE